ncbi:MAG: acetoacetate--CoA ligase [Gammaproteobacteria bacterium]|nr:MAG: acetoacetate--CoA ligase [Gammaproteobacteria bacterium]RLA47887.1 MAG: acetoacetate--CoA ligase [Gammaproteobacteria bacterium]
MSTPLWQPDSEHINQTNMIRFIRFIESEYRIAFENYQQFHQWSVDQSEQFWQSIWLFSELIASEPWQTVLSDEEKFPGASWFKGARLNFAENLLRFGRKNCDGDRKANGNDTDHRGDSIALVSRLENGERYELSYAELFDEVEMLAAGLKAAGVGVGDRVAAFMPNVAETVIAMLATTSLGAIWSSCSPDFGINGVMDRFGQIEPKVLFACDGYHYNGKIINSLPQLKEISQRINSIGKLVIVPVVHRADPQKLDLGGISNAVHYADMQVADSTPPLSFAQLPFDHPLYIMYSSGTTGVPKCIVHSAGGTLLQHLKEHTLHVDLKPEDTLFYFTTCGWMMWNWLVNGLACGATLVLYDGSPFAPTSEALIDMIDEENISIFGTSAKYIAALEKEGIKPRESHELSGLKTILSTGSPLSHESFRYVYRDIKSDVCLSSISGGTDILSCFVLGNPCLPVYEGEIQCIGLGMAVEIWNDSGLPVVAEKGELVCIKPFPSCPISFWNDPDNKKFHQAYFDTYPDIWAHGDYGEITENNGIIIHGRSDAVLNPGGVRIGTAEIYRQVEKVDAVIDSICIGQKWDDDVRVVLFVVLRQGLTLDEELTKTIRSTIRANATPRHVPEKIIQVADIPRTISGKIVELAVRNVVHGEPVKNTDALANPLALQHFADLAQLQS